MAMNTLEYAKVLMTGLDQHVVQNATTGWMEQNAGQVIYNGGNETKIPTMATTGLKNYDRDKGYAQGAVTSKYETYKMTQGKYWRCQARWNKPFLVRVLDLLLNVRSVRG